MTDDTKIASWRELLEKTIELGLGAALLTRESASNIIDDLVKRGAVSKDEGKKLVSHMMERGQSQREKIEEFVSEAVERAMSKGDVARRSTLEKLEERLAALENKLNQ